MAFRFEPKFPDGDDALTIETTAELQPGTP
jgi:hypothetical protein